MVKADIKRNYYADLELSPTASVSEIKKQYHKLALLYHPDRNAGKENEYVPKFQAIQTAHEILGDATSKAKYDADRRKAGLYPTFSPHQPAPGNPYAATSDFPPPPRRTQPGQWQRPPPSSAGAGPGSPGTYYSGPRPAPTARKEPAAAQGRTNMFKAWQNLNGAQERQRRSAPYGVPPSSAPQGPPNRPRPTPRADTKIPTEEEIRAGMNYRRPPPPPPPPPHPHPHPPPPQFEADGAEARRSAWASFQQQKGPAKPGVSRSNTMRTPKRHGFDPNAPGSDERPAGANGYSHRHRSEDLGVPPPPPGPPPTHSPFFTPAASPTPSQRPSADPLRPSKTHAEGEVPGPHIPYAEGNRVRTPYSSFIGERTQFQRDESDGLRRSASTRDATKARADGAASAARARSTSPLRQDTPSGRAAPRTHAPPPPSFGGVDYSDSESGSGSSVNGSSSSSNLDDADGSPTGRYPHAAAAPPHVSSHPSDPPPRPMKVPMPPSMRFSGSNSRSGGGIQSDTEGRPAMQQKMNNTTFTFPFPYDTFSPGGRSRSEENINTEFSPETWSGKFSGSADCFAPPPHSGRKSVSPSKRPKNGPRSTTTPSSATSSVLSDSKGMPAPAPPRSESELDSAASAGNTSFSKEQWEKEFQDASWSMPQRAPNPPSPSKATAAKARGRKASTKAATTGFRAQPSVDNDGGNDNDDDDDDGDDDDDCDSGEAESDAGKPRTGVPVTDDGDAMDIDTAPPVPPKEPLPTGTQSGSAKEPRLYAVPPSNWRQRQQQQAQATGQKAPLSSHSTADAKINTKLDDLANVEPLNRGADADGFKSFADMSSTLPFQSQASTTLPTQPLEPKRLQTPVIPKAPEPPQRLTKESWHAFAAAFGAYLNAYHAFNQTMLQHFATRQQYCLTHLSSGTGWLEAAGDTAGESTGPKGFGSYCKGVREDEQVREAWNLGCERHNEAVKNFEQIRERVRHLALNGGLVDR